MTPARPDRQETDDDGTIGLLIEQIYEQLSYLRIDLRERRKTLEDAARVIRDLLEVLEREPNPSVIQLRASIDRASSWLANHPELKQ
jgi:hypothetical protein